MKTLALLLVAGALAFAQKNAELREVQRDVGLLSQDVKDLKTAVDRVAASSDQAAQSARANGQTLANLDRVVTDRMREQNDRLSVPLATMGSKIDTLSQENLSLRTQLETLSADMKKMQGQMKDLTDAVQMLVANVGRPQAPAPSTPSGADPNSGTPFAGGAGANVPATPPAGVSAEQLYTEALRSKQDSKPDVALDQFQRYLRWYGNTDMASSAQFHIGDIHFGGNRLDQALNAFDKVLTDFPEGPKYPDAMYMKGLVYLKQGQKDKAAAEFKNVNRRFPQSTAGRLAKDQLADLGIRIAPVVPKKRAVR